MRGRAYSNRSLSPRRERGGDGGADWQHNGAGPPNGRDRFDDGRPEGGGGGGRGRYFRDRSSSSGRHRGGGRERRHSIDNAARHARGRGYSRDHEPRDRDRHDRRDDRGGHRDRSHESRREWNDRPPRHGSVDGRGPPDGPHAREGGPPVTTSLVPNPHTDPAVEPLLSFEKWARSGGAVQPLGPGADPLIPLEVRYERYVDQWEERRNDFFVRDHEDEDWFKEKYMLESLLAQEEAHATLVRSEADGFAEKLASLPWLEGTKRNVDAVSKQGSRKRRDRDRDGGSTKREFDVIGDEYESAHIVYIPRVPASVSRQLLEASLKEASLPGKEASVSDEKPLTGEGDANDGESQGIIELLLSDTAQHYRNDKHVRSAWALCPSAAMATRLIERAKLTVTIPGEDDEDDDDDENEGDDDSKNKDAADAEGDKRAKRARVDDADGGDQVTADVDGAEHSSSSDKVAAVGKGDGEGDVADNDDEEDAARAEKRAARRRRARRGGKSKRERTVTLTLEARRRLPNRMCPQESSHPSRISKDLQLASQLAKQLDEMRELDADKRLSAILEGDGYAADDAVIALAKSLSEDVSAPAAVTTSKDDGEASEQNNNGEEKADAPESKPESEGDDGADKPAEAHPLVTYLMNCRKLDITLLWLRRVHLVCYYSGTRFSSRGAMLQACAVPFVRHPLVPGVTGVGQRVTGEGDTAVDESADNDDDRDSIASDSSEKPNRRAKKRSDVDAAVVAKEGVIVNESAMKELKSLLGSPKELERMAPPSPSQGGERESRRPSWTVRWFETLARGVERMIDESSESSATWVREQRAADKAKLAKLKADAVAAFCKENTKAEDANFRCLLPPYKLFRTQEFVESYIRRKHKDRLALVETLASKSMASEIYKREARQKRVEELQRARRKAERGESARHRGGEKGVGRRGGGGGGPPMFQQHPHQHPHHQPPMPFHGGPHHMPHQPPMPFQGHRGGPPPPFHGHPHQSPMGPRGGGPHGGGGGPGPEVAFRHPAVAGPGGPGGPGPGARPGGSRGGGQWTNGRRYRDYDAPAPEEKKPLDIQYRSKVDYSDL